MVALKAELLNKQSQVQKVKQDGFQTIRNRSTRKPVAVKQNSGVEARAKRDEEQKDEDQPTLDKVKCICYVAYYLSLNIFSYSYLLR